MVADTDRSVETMENYIEEQNINQVSAGIIRAVNKHQKQKIACLPEELKQIKSSLADFQVDTNTMSSEKNIAISKVHRMKGQIDEITSEMITRIRKEESEEEIQKLTSEILEDSRILDNRCPENVEILR